MNWKLKAALGWVVSGSPGSDGLYHFIQRRLTRTLPTTRVKFGESIRHARGHLDLIRSHRKGPLEQAVFYEFGAGWDLAIPLTFTALGVRRQILTDIRRLLRPELIRETLNHLGAWEEAEGLGPVPALPESWDRESDWPAVLQAHCGIDYRAPCDARATGLPMESVDCITSTNTLEHVPAGDLARILAECRRILRSDGVLSARIDYQDHYSYSDRRVGVYNFLQYSRGVWAFYNPSLHYQNRLRHKDYLSLFEEAGFKIEGERKTEGTPEDLSNLEGLPLHAEFGSYSRSELAVRGAMIAARKRAGATGFPSARKRILRRQSPEEREIGT